jgi:hypothetical protein
MGSDERSRAERSCIEQLDALPTGELRERAFAKAEHHLDVGFFWDLVKHLPASEGMADEDASFGNITASITEVTEAARELFGRGLGTEEPLIRARFIDYLRSS